MRSRMIAFLSGNAIFWLTPEITDNSFNLLLFASFAVLIIVLIVALFLLQKASVIRIGFKVLLLLFSIGFFVAFQQHNFLCSQITSLPKHTETVLLTGKVASIPRAYPHSASFEVTIEQLNGVAYGSLWRPSVRLSWYYPKQRLPRQGERWQFSVRLKPIHGYRNPQGFDYERWAFSKRLIAKGYVHSKSPSKRLSENTAWIENWRQKINILTKNSLVTHKALINSLLIGDKTQLSKDVRLKLQQSGLAHLLAISGLHIGMVALIAFIFFNWLWKRSQYLCLWLPAKDSALIFSIVIATVYALLSGWAVPAQRALLMLVIFSFNQLFRLQWSLLNTLLFALVLLTATNPVMLLDSSSWLSFGAVFLIVILLRHEKQRPSSLRLRLFKWAKFSIMLWLAMLPITLILFGQMPLLGFAANMIAIPIMSFFIMPLLLLGAFVLVLSEQFAVLLWSFADIGLDIVSTISELLSSSSWQLKFPLEHGFMLAFVMMLWLLPKALINQFPRLLLTLLIAFGFLFKGQLTGVREGASLLVFDVGQGVAALWEQSTDEGEYVRVLFDTGYGSKDYQQANSTWLPYLQTMGINHLDALVVSHNDSDHAGGLAVFEKEISVATIYSGQPLESDLPAISCHNALSFSLDQSSFRALNSIPAEAVELHKDNNASCVMLVEYHGAKILIPGDIEALIEKRLLNSNQLPEVDVVIAPHHGSATSSTEDFVTAINAKNVIFSSGYLNRFKFPRKQVVERYQVQHSQIHNTATVGAIRCRWDKQGGFIGCKGSRDLDWGKWHWRRELR